MISLNNEIKPKGLLKNRKTFLQNWIGGHKDISCLDVWAGSSFEEHCFLSVCKNKIYIRKLNPWSAVFQSLRPLWWLKWERNPNKAALFMKISRFFTVTRARMGTGKTGTELRFSLSKHERFVSQEFFGTGDPFKVKHRFTEPLSRENSAV